MTGAEQRPGPPPSARPSSGRYGWMVGVVALIVVAYISLNTLRTEGPGSTGLQAGEQLLPFAAPLVASDLEGDANVARRANQGEAGNTPACEVTDPRALNICTLQERGPVVLAFLTAGAGKCVRELDAMEEVAARFPQVGFAAVGIKGDRDEFRKLAREHGWSFPLAQDRDGAVANLYAVAICPTVVLAHRGGEVLETALGDQVATPARLAAKVRELVRSRT
ncbi:peroxiredoxin family protein [Conexibacter arvalis]|uniref:Peroxiredoxin n=1 Tax=Conexibacter arvalis TaxID=912552 RepID=A0A840IEP1_9ACTN|nr:TlpA disulfide reductase family protein [Conexibacter arvalis]MBB4662673.1 peroxiredoxin [Conexibacter arvalis]